MLLLLLLSLYSLSSGSKYANIFETYIKNFGKSYTNSQKIHRLEIFSKNLEYISKHNSRNHSYRLGFTKFTDWTNTEFKSFVSNPAGFNTSDCTNATNQSRSYAKSVDWRKKGAVTDVKNQFFCGSCYAFSTTGALEGFVAIKTGNLTALSEQEIIDCSIDYGNEGCGGGLMSQSFRYIIDNHGLCSEAAYSYAGIQNSCTSNQCKSVAGTNIGNCYNVPANDEYTLGYYASQQPISVAIEASSDSFQHYVSGIYNDDQCYDGNLDHGVLLVGFNDNTITPYYIVKNSWGKEWGLSGYIMMARNPKGNGAGMCGITLVSSFPTY